MHTTDRLTATARTDSLVTCELLNRTPETDYPIALWMSPDFPFGAELAGVLTLDGYKQLVALRVIRPVKEDGNA